MITRTPIAACGTLEVQLVSFAHKAYREVRLKDTRYVDSTILCEVPVGMTDEALVDRIDAELESLEQLGEIDEYTWNTLVDQCYEYFDGGE